MTRGAAVAAVTIGIGIAPAAAQTVPVPPPPRPPMTADQTVGAPWDYTFGLGLGWDGNVDFRVPGGPRGAAVMPQAALGRVFRSARSELRATGSARWAAHPGLDGVDHRVADLALVGRAELSPRMSGRAAASYGLGDSGSSRVLVDQGVLAPVVTMRTLTATAGLSRRLAPQTSLRIDARLFRTTFDSSALIDGDSARVTIGLERRTDTRGTVAAELASERVGSERPGGAYVTHFGSLQWAHVLSTRTALLAEGGASYTPDAARAGLARRESFFGGATLTRQLRRSSARLFVRHEVTPAFGSGVSRVALRAGLLGIFPVGRDWRIRLDGIHVRSTDAGTGSSTSSDAFAAVGRRVGRRLEVSAEARYRRRSAFGTQPAIDAFRAGIVVLVLPPSGRAIGQGLSF